MMSPDELHELDETLSVQLRLALASPLWKNLPYGLQINPRAWSVELLDARPRRRLCARITIPWRPGVPQGEPLHYLVLIWPSGRYERIHGLLSRLNARLARPAQQTRRRMIFYDALSHALVTQFHTQIQAPAGPAPFNARWARRLIQTLHRGLKTHEAL